MEALNKLSKSLPKTGVADICSLQGLMEKYSPLSDFRKILHEENISLHHIKIVAQTNSRFPMRNIVRLLAKIATLQTAEISMITFSSMDIGCDFFGGSFFIDYCNEESEQIEFKWQWTAFHGLIDFDKFVTFDRKKTVEPISKL